MDMKFLNEYTYMHACTCCIIQVMQASLLLHAIDAEVVRRIVTLLASKVALSFQAKKIEDLVRTGLLQSQDAEVLIEDITHDVNVIRSEKAKEMK